MRVKICGVTRAADAIAAAEAGASAIGFVFWPGSPRWIDARAAREIVRALPPFVTPVGVFVDQSIEEMERIARDSGVRVVQLHGRESADTCRRLSLPVIKAVALDGDGAAHDGSAGAPDLPPEVTLLLDAHDPVRFGGTGITIDWDRAAKVATERRVILSGGLTPANVGAAIRAVRPYGVDVSSGVETAPGVKDAGLVRAFVHNAHAAGFGPAFGRRDPAPGGWFGPYGGRFVPETLVTPLEELERAYLEARLDASFGERLAALLSGFAGRPTPLHAVERLGAANGGARLFLKREDLAHTGAHKINNAIGQALLAQRMGKRRIVAETGAGQHGVATATACALLGLACVVYMGAEDMERQAPNVHRMRLLGAEVRRVDAGSRTLKDAINEAMRDWVASVRDTHYLLGSVLGPHPYPLMVREFQSVIGEEAKEQMRERTGGPPSAVVACIGGGSNALGIFDAFVADPGVRLIGVEAGGEGIETGRHAARFPAGHVGVLHGTRSVLLQDEDGNVDPTWSVAAGLDYPAIGPEHAWLREQGRAEYAWVPDEAALDAFHALARHEGILPALESAHAVAYALELAREIDPSATVLVNLSGRGDKDLASVGAAAS